MLRFGRSPDLFIFFGVYMQVIETRLYGLQTDGGLGGWLQWGEEHICSQSVCWPRLNVSKSTYRDFLELAQCIEPKEGALGVSGFVDIAED